MSITIVASFAPAAVLGASAAGGASDPLAVGDESTGLDFASVLLAQPVSAAPLASESSEAVTDDMATLPEAAPDFAGGELLAMLGLNQLNQLPSLQAVNPASRGDRAEIAPLSTSLPTPGSPLSISLPTPGSPLLASAATASASSESAQGSSPGSDERGAWAASTAPMAWTSAGKAAKFAVADLLAPAFGQNDMKRPEQQVLPASNLATLSPVSQAPNASAGIVPETSLGLQTALRDPSWATDFGQKLLWFAASDKQLAQLTLNPPQLGSIEITLKIDKDSANAHFVSANADVRGAIEAALPRLREMFANAGIDLGQVSVGSESFRQSADSQRQASGSPRPVSDTAILGGDSVSALLGQSISTHRGSALVDIFA
ncbi:MAG: flagellar hook-length control protein FliK [Candidatus Accumulibacter phosphatis]|jgi:flagellar hook-length control protein FliK|uniref:flagellar hook-length control protein FliK n=1 Tax=Candidatus Accumulibacter sp. ACC012 TaxID=2823332 RepID=UPI0025BDE7B1|nr:flagellar hook-length control protein FliK [Candidatus Accumulibacter sp. ACC012]